MTPPAGWAALQESALDKLAAVRAYLDECLTGHHQPTPGELSRAAGLLLYAAGALHDADALASPATPTEGGPHGHREHEPGGSSEDGG